MFYHQRDSSWCGTIEGVEHASWAHFNLILSESIYSNLSLFNLYCWRWNWFLSKTLKHLLPSHLPWLQCLKGGLEHTDRDSAAGDTGDGVFQWFEIRASWDVPSLFRREFRNRTEGIWLKVHDSKNFSSFESYITYTVYFSKIYLYCPNRFGDWLFENFELPFVSKRCGIRTPVPLLNGHTGHHGSTSKTYGCFLGCLDCLGEIGHIWLNAQVEWGCATIRAAARGFEVGIGWYREQMTRWVNDMHLAMYWLEEMKASESTPDSQHQRKPVFDIKEILFVGWKQHMEKHPSEKRANFNVTSPNSSGERRRCETPWCMFGHTRNQKRSVWRISPYEKRWRLREKIWGN